jgi:hypothetical protein
MNVRGQQTWNAERRRRFPVAPKIWKPASRPAVSSGNEPTEIAMSRKMIRTLCTAMLCAGLLPVASAIAAQGPGAATGTAGGLTRMTMAILVYGTAAVIVGAGLIGALRRRR